MTPPMSETQPATIAADAASGTPRAYWSAVFAMSVCVFALIASEFLPVNLLTPIAVELGVSEGWVGYGIAISGAFAVLPSWPFSLHAPPDKYRTHTQHSGRKHPCKSRSTACEHKNEHVE